MINAPSLQAVNTARWNDHFCRPLYESYCFSAIPRLLPTLFAGGPAGPTTALLLGPLVATYDKVVLLFIDAFGWRFLQQYQDQYPFLSRFAHEGMMTKLTSQFPSTTAAHATTIHTGLEVGQSGVYEWFYYEPTLDAMIAPLLFSFAGDRERNTLRKAGVNPTSIYPQSILYPALAALGVQSYIFAHQSLVPAPFGEVVCAGAHLRPYATFSEALSSLVESMLAVKERAYFFLYFDRIDGAGHRYGPQSTQFATEVHACFSALESILHNGLSGTKHTTLLLLTADHGQVEIHPSTTVYLNIEYPVVASWMKTSRKGRPLVPAGSCRDMFLHIREEHLAEAHGYLQERLAGKAEVYRVADLIAQGFFGTAPPSPTFLGRVGNLLILPYPHQSVWWYEEGRFAQSHHGAHGGLTAQEMETQLLALPYG